jgi:hypothetical protein
MLSRKLFTSACAAAAMFALSAVPAHAQGGPIDSRTEFTFNAPVELPGVTLPPGTYVFRFADATTGRRVMQVQTKDSTNKTYGMFLTISAQRPRPSDEAELRFLETPAGAPAAIKTWWYPGNSIGREFIYPKSQARRLAQATNTNVLTTQAESVTNEQMQTADLAYVSPTGQETAVTDEQLVAAAQNTAPVGTSGTTAASSSTNSSAASRSASTSSSGTNNYDQRPMQVGQSASNSGGRTRLPRTNTLLPLAGLIGVASLLAGTFRFRQ